ncbi:hypothetical protein E2C01_089979 [Portunus trituberculatus]|uniref:Uncharacterized protein n=1 Tax=Portunus trituberculatus TaxID=210409 RepID=A0A5B7JK78_PORTR|nr:hypothetical protein [Portunus trituberculatus]
MSEGEGHTPAPASPPHPTHPLNHSPYLLPSSSLPHFNLGIIPSHSPAHLSSPHLPSCMKLR